MRREILKIANACVRPFGLKLQTQRVRLHERVENALHHLIHKGCHPTTCIDVGAAHGTLPFYEAFPKSKHLLIESLAEYESEIKLIMRKYECFYEKAAAGSTPGILKINLKERITGSSIFCELPGIDQGAPREVRMVTLDQICEDRKLPGPYLVKIDVEGAEMEVVKGSEKIIGETLAFILELTFVARLVNVPEAGEVIGFMAARDFVLYDIFGLRTHDDGTLFQADAIFVPRDSFLRS